MSIQEQLRHFDPQTAGKYDPGQIIILFDGRIHGPTANRMSYIQTGWMSAKYYLGWPSIWYTDLDPGTVRLVFYAPDGTEKTKSYPLWQANAAKEGFDYCCEQGMRPMLLGWSAENPYPMIGGHEPPPEPKKPKVRVATTWSGTASGHGTPDTPHDRIMAIINKEEEREAEQRRKEVEEVGTGEIAV